MARNTDHLAGKFETSKTGGLLNGFLAEEPAFDRRLKLRLAVWGLAAFAFVGAAMISSQSPILSWRDLAGDLARQSQQIQSLTKEGQNESRRLASAIDMLNADRDRLYSRVTVLEQGLDSMTGTLARQNSATPWPEAAAPLQLPPSPPSPESIQEAAPAAKPETGAMGPQSSTTASAQAATTSAAPQPPSPSPVPAHAPQASPVAATAAKPAAGSPSRQSASTGPPPITATGALTPESSSPPQNPGPAPRVTPVATTTPKPETLTPARQSRSPAPPQIAASASPATEPTSTSQNPTDAQLASARASMVTKAAKIAEKPAMDTTAATDQGPASVSSTTSAASSMSAASPAPPLMAPPSLMAPPDAAAAKLLEPEKAAASTLAPAEMVTSASTEPDSSQTTSSKPAIQRTEFAVDVGGASSVSGLRAMWRGLLKSNSALAKLDPIIVVREGSGGMGMQLRLVAGPLDDAAAAAKICAALTENERTCEPTVFDGQRLTMKGEEPSPPEAKSPTTKPAAHRHSGFRRGASDESAKKPEMSSLYSFFGKR